MSPIYTRQGDAGETGLGDSRRVSKTHPRVEAIGAIDELNSSIGLALSLLPTASQLPNWLRRIQHTLLIIGAHLALPEDADAKYQKRLPALPADLTFDMEQAIDIWWQTLPPLTQFILPGGTPAAAALHVSRSLARRAERSILALQAAEKTLSPTILIFTNRLSDFLFAAARWANFENGQTDILWNKGLSDKL